MKWYIKKNSLSVTAYIIDVYKLTQDINKALSFNTKTQGLIYLIDNKMSTCSCENKLIEL